VAVAAGTRACIAAVLEVFQAVAIRLYWLRPVALCITAVCAGFFGYAVFTDNAPDNHLTAGLIGTLWGLVLFAFLNIFPTVPPLPTPDQSVWQRFKLRIRRAGYVLLMVAVLALTIASMSASLKLLKSLSG